MVWKLRAGDVLRKRSLAYIHLLSFFFLNHALTFCNHTSVRSQIEMVSIFYDRPLRFIFLLIFWASIEFIELQETASASGTCWISDHKIGLCVLREVNHSSMHTICITLFLCIQVELDRSKIYFKAFFFKNSFRIVSFLSFHL